MGAVWVGMKSMSWYCCLAIGDAPVPPGAGGESERVLLAGRQGDALDMCALVGEVST